MRHTCYILYSLQLDKFYTGYSTLGAETRLVKHLSDHYGIEKFTHKAKDWELFLGIECEDPGQARKIENHIKKMKSQKYIRDLKMKISGSG